MTTSRRKSSHTISEFENFKRLLKGIANVPKKEIEAEEAKWREARRLKKKNAPS
jgi:hypothetical protein